MKKKKRCFPEFESVVPLNFFCILQNRKWKIIKVRQELCYYLVFLWDSAWRNGCFPVSSPYCLNFTQFIKEKTASPMFVLYTKGQTWDLQFFFCKPSEIQTILNNKTDRKVAHISLTFPYLSICHYFLGNMSHETFLKCESVQNHPVTCIWILMTQSKC